MAKSIGVIDYEMGNTDSMCRAIEECGGIPVLSSDRSVLSQTDKLILPGVGSFSQGMENLTRKELIPIIRELVIDGVKPILGVCLGMHLFASRGEEGGQTDGLGLIEGSVNRMVPKQGERIPHVGWNSVQFDDGLILMKGISQDKDFYFVHSYCFVCEDLTYSVARTPYSGGFTSIIRKANIYGTQFHPEKSQKPGFAILRNFIEYA